jgi:CHAD domain-containing protein
MRDAIETNSLVTDEPPPVPAERRGRTPSPRRRRAPSITVDDTMAEAARKTLLVQWERVLRTEPKVREHSDGELVHDLRVATRRMRVALRVFGGYLDRDAFRPFRKRLRRTARVLGAVRDLDVLCERTQRYLETLSEDRTSELDALLAAWKAEHERARGELIEWIDGDTFAQFKTEFDEFVRRPGAGAAPTETRSGRLIAHRVRDLLPIVLLRGWAAVRAYDESACAPDPSLEHLHQLRIACKRLRYTLEFFESVLDADAQALIGQLIAVQDHLGNVQDGVVACNILQGFLPRGEWSPGAKKASRRPRTVVVAPGVAAYFAARQSEIQSLVQTFPNVWAPIGASTFKRQLLALIADW